ncbi:hypothetical protein DACRYDRAFT_99886 [Dacryopinax primogenitus]|uniref:HCP-like protein n=1 Tax=Dacryopinax primogenitus (strain DJM 731) TaxID=1858805 RepID=M5G082_DACPD|nr:uncharacterized protein DACRYDRAFT_99886 [Dacryopinax primogenitus]EJU02159.1 hypothetical protein DACRYDRAFT_99886 [Dacryopinax primogenitus]
MHRCLLCSAHARLITRQMHSSVGRLSSSPGAMATAGAPTVNPRAAHKRAARAAMRPQVMREGSLFDPGPDVAHEKLEFVFPAFESENPAEVAVPQSETDAVVPHPTPSINPTPEVLDDTSEPPPAEEPPDEYGGASEAVYEKLIHTLGETTVKNLLALMPSDVVRELSEMCIYASLDQLIDWCQYNVFGYLREEPKSLAHGMFTLSTLIIPTTGVSTSIRHRLRMAGRIDINKLYTAQTNSKPPVNVQLWNNANDEDIAEEATSRLDIDYYKLRLEHGDYKAQIGMAFLEETAIRQKLKEGKYVQEDLDEARQRLVHYLESAVEHNFAGAAFKLGQLYEEGIVLPQDAGKMVHFYEQAIVLGNLAGAVRLAELYQSRGKYLSNGNVPILPLDRAKAIFYHEISARRFAASAAAAGIAYFRRPSASFREHTLSFGVKPDDARAAFYLGLASDQGSWVSRRHLADMLILDRTDVPEEKRDDTARRQSKRVRQLEYAVNLLENIPDDSNRSNVSFLVGLKQARELANTLLQKAMAGERAMDFDPMELTQWRPWRSSTHALKVLAREQNNRQGRNKYEDRLTPPETRDFQVMMDKRRDMELSDLLSLVKEKNSGANGS